MSSSIIISFYIPHIKIVILKKKKIVIWYFSFSIWVTSLSMTLSRSIHVAADGIISFFQWLSNIPLYICATSFSSIPSNPFSFLMSGKCPDIFHISYLKMGRPSREFKFRKQKARELVHSVLLWVMSFICFYIFRRFPSYSVFWLERYLSCNKIVEHKCWDLTDR